MVKNPHSVWKTWIHSLGWEDPLETRMATNSSILASRIPCTEEPGGLPSMRSHRVGHNRSDLAAEAAYIYLHPAGSVSLDNSN